MICCIKHRFHFNRPILRFRLQFRDRGTHRALYVFRLSWKRRKLLNYTETHWNHGVVFWGGGGVWKSFFIPTLYKHKERTNKLWVRPCQFLKIKSENQRTWCSCFKSFSVRIFTIFKFHNYLDKGNSLKSTYPEGLQNARCLLGKKYDFSRTW